MSQGNEGKPVVLVIFDGFGDSSRTTGNAVAQAAMPMLDTLKSQYPHTLLGASGEYVGLLPGYIGNSEVGHLTLGAGRVTKGMLATIHQAIDDGSFFQNQVLIKDFEQLQQSKKTLHLMGLISDGGVHSHEYHLHALLKIAAQCGIKQVFVHAFLDGRDVAPQSAERYLARLQQVFQHVGVGKISSVHGRFYAMDRDSNAERTQVSYDILVGKGCVKNVSWEHVLEKSYDQGVTDEFIEPVLLNGDAKITRGDGVIFFNFRPDRARQLTNMLNTNQKKIGFSFFLTMTRYHQDFTNNVLFENRAIENTLLDALAEQLPYEKNRAFIIAESEKRAHVTYFFRGMREVLLPGEKCVIVPSKKMQNYAQSPEMSACEITQRVVQALDEHYRFYFINYANADMVGHSGDLQAAIKACEVLDQQLAVLYQEIVEKRNGTIVLTSDHGNAECMIDEATGKPITAHTSNPVPILFVAKDLKEKKVEGNNLGLAHVAPLLLTLMQLKIPNDMCQEVICIK